MEKGYYLKEYIEKTQFYPCLGILFLEACGNLTIFDLRLEGNRCDWSAEETPG